MDCEGEIKLFWMMFKRRDGFQTTHLPYLITLTILANLRVYCEAFKILFSNVGQETDFFSTKIIEFPLFWIPNRKFEIRDESYSEFQTKSHRSRPLSLLLASFCLRFKTSEKYKNSSKNEKEKVKKCWEKYPFEFSDDRDEY